MSHIMSLPVPIIIFIYVVYTKPKSEKSPSLTYLSLDYIGFTQVFPCMPAQWGL